MTTRGTPVRWWLFFVPAIFVLSCFFVFQTLQSPPASSEPDRLKPEWYALSTTRGNDLEENPWSATAGKEWQIKTASTPPEAAAPLASRQGSDSMVNLGC